MGKGELLAAFDFTDAYENGDENGEIFSRGLGEIKASLLSSAYLKSIVKMLLGEICPLGNMERDNVISLL